MLGGGVTVQSDISRLMAIPTGAFKADGSPVTATGLAKQGGYTLLDLMLRYNLSKDLSLSGNFTNVLDKKYYRNIGFFNGGYYGQPARVLVSLRWKY
jgi:outer-membrane receptor for ferric coprogen and ferric-rhodotorulic acid